MSEISAAYIAIRLGCLCAFISLFAFPEIFGPIAVILGAYAWKRMPDATGAPITIAFGIVAMIVGLFFTATVKLINFL